MLFVFAAGGALLLAAFTASRLALRERPPAEERGGFTNVPITSPVIAELGPGDAGRARALAEPEARAAG